MRQTHKQLEREGWLRQFVADEDQAKDAVEIYDLLGYEVHLRPTNQSPSKKCSSLSSKESEGECRIVYIRPKRSRTMRKSKPKSGQRGKAGKEMAIEERMEEENQAREKIDEKENKLI